MTALNRYTIDVLEPNSSVESEPNELLRVADILKYPLLIRSSVAESGEPIKIIYSSAELVDYFGSLIGQHP